MHNSNNKKKICLLPATTLPSGEDKEYIPNEPKKKNLENEKHAHTQFV